MKNEQFIEVLKELKKEGVNYKYICDNCDIPRSTFSYYLKNHKFPFTARKRIEEFINTEFKEILENE